jgi:polyisoprenoid-binding protein YceI
VPQARAIILSICLLLLAVRAQAQQPSASPPPVVDGTPGARPRMQPQPPERLHFVLAMDGNEARYRVREQLANLDFPSDAVGVTKGITGGLLLNNKGMIVPDSSRFVIDLKGLASDETRRDRYVQRNTLKTDSFPEVVFVPTEVKEMSRPPVGVPASFQLGGNLTVHGITRPTIWDVTVKEGMPDVVGTASTSFAFSDFGLSQPRVSLLLSVKDTIRLEYDFHFIRAP